MRFSLRTLFLIVSVLGVYLATAFATPPIVSAVGLTLVTYAMPPVVVTGVVYDRGYAHTFWIGCASAGTLPYLIAVYYGFGAGVMVLTEWGDIDSSDGRILTIAVTVCHSLVFFSGGIAMVTRWLIEKKNGNAEPSAAPDRTILSRRIAVELESGE